MAWTPGRVLALGAFLVDGYRMLPGLSAAPSAAPAGPSEERRRRNRRRAWRRPPARAVWRPVVAQERVVDLVLASVDRDAADLLALPAANAVGQAMTALFPDSALDGRLAAFCAVAATGQPFRLTRPATARSPGVLLAAHRSAGGQVVVEVQPETPGDGPRTRSRDERRWQRLFEHAPLGVAVLTIDGYVVEANRALLAMLARRPDEVVGARFHDFAHPHDPTRLDRRLLLRTGHATLEKRYLRGDGRDLWLRAATSLVVEDGEQRVLSICEDVTETRRAQASLAHRADHDPLTGLPNRELLRRRLSSALEGMRAGDGTGVGLLFLDLDRFKVINDSLGHAAGDRLLREVAARLHAGIAGGDLLARLGGDEFALVTPDDRGAVTLGRRLVETLQAPFVLDGREVTVGASIGVALRSPTDGGSAADEDALLREADTAMYAAKRAGEGPVVVFEETLRRRAVARLEDEQGLRRALQRGELRVHYQPILRLDDLSTAGFEALVRWQHPDRGLLAPGAFLPTAEETGLVVPLGQHLLRESCAALAAWRRTGAPGRMSVNVSAQHLASGTLRADVEQALEASGLEPDALTLEITEQALVVSHEKAAAVLGELRERGCQVALDDFGTGYSSLAYLRRLPVDVLKIDRTFVAGATAPVDDGRLLSAITALGTSLGLRTVVEGIESPAELAAARAAGATHVQGYLLGPPSPALVPGRLDGAADRPR